MPNRPAQSRRLPRSNFEVRYNRFLEALRHEILSGRRRPGELLDSESTLTRAYSLSLGSVRKGIQELVNEGLVEKAHGRGTVVRYTGSGDSDTLKFAVYSPVIEEPILSRILSAFAAANPATKVHVIRLARVGFEETLCDLVRSGDGPDLMFVSNRAFSELSRSIHLLDLESALDSEVARWNLYPQTIDAFRVQGRLRAAPLLFSPIMLAYNQDLFDKAHIPYPDGTWTWHTLREMARRLTFTDSTGTAQQYGFGISLQAHRWPAFLLQNEASILSDATTDERHRVLEAVQYTHNLLFHDRVSPLGDASTGATQESFFMAGRVAMILSSYQALSAMHSLPFRMDITVPPKGRTRATLLLSAGLAINGESPRKASALSLLRFFMRKESQRAFQELGCSLPTRREVCEDSTALNPSIHPISYHLYRQVMAYAHPLDALGAWPRLEAFLGQLNMVWSNLTTPEEGCRRAFASIEQLTSTRAEDGFWADEKGAMRITS